MISAEKPSLSRPENATEKKYTGSPNASLTRSCVVWAFVALILLDIGARSTHRFWNLDPYLSPNRSWVWWNTEDFVHNAHQPDVVLMGSSLMMAALHGGDATYLNIPQNVAFHHRSTYLEQLLGDKLHTPVSTFAFAIGGQMASDAYVLASTLFRGEHKPHTIIYGIAPRDLMDNTIASPASTETFRYMERVGNLSQIGLSSRTSFWEQAEWLTAQISFLYNKRPEFVYLQNKYARESLALLCGIKGLDFVHTPVALRKIALLELPEDEGPNDLTVMPASAQVQSYFDNLPEYRRRYRSFKPKLYNTQMSFLQKLLGFCDDNGINIVLVNMPLTQDNVNIMPPGFYHRYLQNMRELATQHHASVIDMQDTNVFPKSMFADSVHLNGYGGKRFFEVLSSRLLNESRMTLGKNAVIN